MSLMENIAVLDSSALIAFFDYETGWQFVDYILVEKRCVISAVNFSELVAKLVERESPLLFGIETLMTLLRVEVIDFKHDSAIQAGFLRKQTRPKGLSLGDRACIALALEVQAPIMTSDQVWQTLELPVAVINIRTQTRPA